MERARRAFVVGWLLLVVAGALNHTVALAVFGRRFDLILPHLKYGHVMFNKNPRQVQRYFYSGADGVRHDLADLVITPAPGYQRARLAITMTVKPDYLAELCLRARRAGRGELTFIVEDIDLDAGTTTSHESLCGAHGLLPR